METQPVETTLYSLSDSPPRACEGADQERREGERHVTLFRVGSLTIDERRELCLIKNISAGGMKVRAYCPIPVGSRVSVELKCGYPISGAATWCREPDVGIAFDQPIDVIDILSHSMEGPRPRQPRVEIDYHVSIREGANVLRVKACDISQGGLKVQTDAQIAPGTDLIVSLDGLPALPAVMRWNHSGYSGITFNRVVALPELIDWLNQMRESVKSI